MKRPERLARACPSEVKLVYLQAVTSLLLPCPCLPYIPSFHPSVFSTFRLCPFFLFSMTSISFSSPNLHPFLSLTCFNSFLISHDPSKLGRLLRPSCICRVWGSLQWHPCLGIEEPEGSVRLAFFGCLCAPELFTVRAG